MHLVAHVMTRTAAQLMMCVHMTAYLVVEMMIGQLMIQTDTVTHLLMYVQ